MTHCPMCVIICVQRVAVDKVLSEFRCISGEDAVSLGEAVRQQHGKDESVHRSVCHCYLFHGNANFSSIQIFKHNMLFSGR